MWKATIIVGVLCVVTKSANFCQPLLSSSRDWSMGLADGVNDFAYTGVALNNSYYCFIGCLNTGQVYQTYKVKLQHPREAITRRMTYEEKVARFSVKPKFSALPKPTQDPDPNADTCIDPVLRADINTALQKATNHSAKAIARTIQYEINRPGNVVESKGDTFDLLFQDMNFCQYSAFIRPELYDIRLAAIDFSTN